MTDEGKNDPELGPLLEQFPIPVGRPGKREEIAALVAFLLGPDGRFFCGSLIFNDGGTDALLRGRRLPAELRRAADEPLGIGALGQARFEHAFDGQTASRSPSWRRAGRQGRWAGDAEHHGVRAEPAREHPSRARRSPDSSAAASRPAGVANSTTSRGTCGSCMAAPDASGHESYSAIAHSSVGDLVGAGDHAVVAAADVERKAAGQATAKRHRPAARSCGRRAR